VTIKIQNTNTVKSQTHCLVYGPSKSGKTRLIPTSPQPIICSTDNGLSSIREHQIPFVECKTYAEVQEFVEWVMKSPDSKKFQTIVFDDLTEIGEQILIAEKPKHKNLMQAYGALNDEINFLIRKLRNLQDQNVVFICKQERIKDEATGGLIYGPKIPGQAVSQALPYLVGEVYHTEVWVDPKDSKSYEVLRTKRNNQCDAGSRSGKLGELELANLGAIFQKVVS
jgi:AAA domain